MSEKVHELETLGFVERKVSTDERESLVSMTPRGEAEVMCILTPMKEKCERVFHNLTDAQMQTLVSYLNMITI
jgi:DNA-binding MarR family transcriptional regulator